MKQEEAKYEKVKHLEDSKSLIRKTAVVPNHGSGDHSMIFMIDVRLISTPLEKAQKHYRKEGDKLKLIELHVDSYDEAFRKFRHRWKELGIEIPEEKQDKIVIITQLFQP